VDVIEGLDRLELEKKDSFDLMAVLVERQTAKAEDMMRGAVVAAQGYFDKVYN
jgi:hypothetical protein